VTLLLNALSMIALPIAIAVAVRRRTGGRWAWVAWGAATFVGSQLVHLPILGAWGALTRSGALPSFGTRADYVVLGLLAAACEEPARAVVFRFAIRSRGRSAALMAGAGHGGVEAVVFGALALAGAINVLAIRGRTASDLVAMGVAAETADAAVADAREALAMPWYEALGGAFERGVAIPLHLACSVLVMAAMRRRSAWPFVAAFAGHAIVDASIGFLRDLGQSVTAIELELAAISLPFTIAALVWASRSEPADADVAP
jgi:uncharacterized membrane protein YhfC